MSAPDAAAGLHVLQLGLEWFGDGVGGGASRVMADLMAALPEAGVRASGVVAGPRDVAAHTDGRVRAFAGEGHSLPRRLWGARRAVAGALRRERVDVVAAHFALYAAPCLDRLARVPLVAHFHGPWAAESQREGAGRAAVAAKAALERLVYRRAARVIVLSEAFAALATGYGIDPARLRVIPGAVDLARFAVRENRAEARARLGWPVERRIVLSVRRLDRRMGLDRLLEAWPDVVRAAPDALLLVAGRGPLAGALRAQAGRLGLSGHVRFLGFVPDADLPLCYRAADLAVVPSAELEGFGLTAAEALAAGTPCLVTPVGGLPEVVSGLSPSLVLRSACVAEIAAGLAAALSGRMALPDAGACARYAMQRFGRARMAEAVAGVYREVLAA